MEILGIGPGRQVGDAYRFLLELRMDNGPMSEEAATAALRAWAATAADAGLRSLHTLTSGVRSVLTPRYGCEVGSRLLDMQA